MCAAWGFGQVEQITQLELEKKTLLEGFTHEMKTPIMASQLLLANIKDGYLMEQQQESLFTTENELKKTAAADQRNSFRFS